MKFLVTNILLILLTVSFTFAQSGKESIFGDVQKQIEEARESHAEILSPEFFAKAVENFKTAEEYLAGVSNDFRVEFRFKTKEENWLWILGRGKIIEQDQEGKPLRFVGTHTDINDQKAVEEQLSTYQLKLELRLPIGV